MQPLLQLYTLCFLAQATASSFSGRVPTLSPGTIHSPTYGETSGAASVSILARSLAAALAATPQDSGTVLRIYNALGNAQMRYGLYKDAHQTFQEAQRLTQRVNPDDTCIDCRLNIARLQLARSFPQEAQHELNELIRGNVRNAVVYRLLGDAYRAQLLFEESEESYEKALVNSNDRFEVLETQVERAELYLLFDFDKAKVLLQRLLRESDDELTSSSSSALIYVRLLALTGDLMVTEDKLALAGNYFDRAEAALEQLKDSSLAWQEIAAAVSRSAAVLHMSAGLGGAAHSLMADAQPAEKAVEEPSLWQSLWEPSGEREQKQQHGALENPSELLLKFRVARIWTSLLVWSSSADRESEDSAALLRRMADVLLYHKKRPLAMGLYEKVIDMHVRHGRRINEESALAHNNLASILGLKGADEADLQRAHKLYEDCVEIRSKLQGDSRDVAIAYNNAASVLCRLGDQRCKEYYTDALRVARSVGDDEMVERFERYKKQACYLYGVC